LSFVDENEGHDDGDGDGDILRGLLRVMVEGPVDKEVLRLIVSFI